MATITTRIPDKLDNTLSLLAKETERGKGYLIRKAIESYIEERGDLLIALSSIEKEEETISLSEIEKKYDLED